MAQRPDLIAAPEPTSSAAAGVGRLVWVGAVAALLIAAFVAPFASEGADGLEAVAERAQFDALEQSPRVLLLEDYAIPLPGVDISRGFWQKASVSLAGVFGTVCVLGMAWMFGRWLRPGVAATEASHGR